MYRVEDLEDLRVHLRKRPKVHPDSMWRRFIPNPDELVDITSESSSSGSPSEDEGDDEGFCGYYSGIEERTASERRRHEGEPSVPNDEAFDDVIPIECILEDDAQRPPWRPSPDPAVLPVVQEREEEPHDPIEPLIGPGDVLGGKELQNPATLSLEYDDLIYLI